MRIIIKLTLTVALGLVGIGLFYLTNTGILSFRQPAIRQISAGLRPTHPTAFINVNVIPMDSERILPNQMVIVHHGRITQIGEGLALPDDVVVVEGNGRYLMPGLIDMHVHIKEENELLLFVANGVTTVRDMWGTTGMQLALGVPDQLILHEQVKQNQLLGPQIFTAGTIMEGDPPTTPLMPIIATQEEAIESVKWQAAQGYDFIKVYDNLTPETYQAILAAAQAQGLPVVGHVPKLVGLTNVLGGGQQTIEHLSGYIDPDTVEFLIPPDQTASFAKQTLAAGAWNCVTLSVYTKNVPPEQLDTLENQPGMTAVSPRMKALWRIMLPQIVPGEASPDYPVKIAQINQQVTQALHTAGAGILLGTDTDNPYQVPGFSLLDELDLLVEAGLTPTAAFFALAAAAEAHIVTANEVQKRPCKLTPASYYEIVVAGHLDNQWSDWFDGLTLITGKDDTTQPIGPMADQAALHGLLSRIRDLNLPLISVQRKEMLANANQP